jgi:Tetracyclin repressor-like, C-terminal domain
MLKWPLPSAPQRRTHRATYVELTAGARQVVKAHVDTLVGQLAQIITDGASRGELETTDPHAAARAVFDATARFHNPVHAAEWSDPQIDAEYEGARALLVSALEHERSPRSS